MLCSSRVKVFDKRTLMSRNFGCNVNQEDIKMHGKCAQKETYNVRSFHYK
jgi:hypothetical protein